VVISLERGANDLRMVQLMPWLWRVIPFVRMEHKWYSQFAPLQLAQWYFRCFGFARIDANVFARTDVH